MASTNDDSRSLHASLLLVSSGVRVLEFEPSESRDRGSTLESVNQGLDSDFLSARMQSMWKLQRALIDSNDCKLSSDLDLESSLDLPSPALE